MDLATAVRSNVAAHSLAPAGARLLVAVSGGVDSMVLLHVLAGLAAEADWKLTLGHFQHGLRGAESAEDEAFVRQIAAERGMQCLVGSGSVLKLADEEGISMEMAARRLRHDFLAKAAAEQGISRIALGHHLDDQVELFWLRLLRGSVSLRLMGWSNPSPGDRSITLIRPLLNVRRNELLAHARKYNISYREDSSNRGREPLRNRLRLDLLPMVEQLAPGYRETTARIAEALSVEKDFIHGLAEQWIAARAEPFASLHPALQRAILRRQLEASAIEPSFVLIELLRTRTEPVMVAPGRTARQLDGIVQFEQLITDDFNYSELALILGAGGSVDWHGCRLAWEIVPDAVRIPGTEHFDADVLGESATLRHWRPGDEFQPIGLGARAKLQDLFVNAKTPRAERRTRLVLAAADGEIAWVEGLRIGEKAKLTDLTRRVLRFSWQRVSLMSRQTSE